MALFTDDILAAATAAPIETPLPAGLGDDAWLAMSQALVPAGDVIVPGMVRPFLPHQAAAHEYGRLVLQRWGCLLLGHDMGLGKTQMALAHAAEALDARGGFVPFIIPPVAKAGYMGDIAATFPHLRVAHLKGRSAPLKCKLCGDTVVPASVAPLPACGVGTDVCEPVFDIPDADIYLINDDPATLKAWLVDVTIEHDRDGVAHEVLAANAFIRGATLLARDELHRDKGENGRATGVRTKVMACVGKALRAQGTPLIGMTGTLLTNRPVEGMLPLTWLGSEELVKAITPGANTAAGYLWRYCDVKKVHIGRGQYRNDYSGVSLDEMHHLHEYLRRTIYARIEKSDLGEDTLPNSGWKIVPVALPDSAMREYDRWAKDFLNMVLETGGPDAYWRAARNERLVQIGKLWMAAGKAKAEAACDYVKDLVDQHRQVVVFHHHRDTMHAMLQALAKARITYTVIDGDVSGDAREQAIAEFQDGHAQVMLAQMGAAGIAVTLTAAADAVWLQTPWAAGTLKQCADRILRCDDRTAARAKAGEAITWHVLQSCYSDGTPSFDQAMYNVVARKCEVVDAVNAGRAVTMSEDDVMFAALQEWMPQAAARYRP